jgi:hypothetical protein
VTPEELVGLLAEPARLRLLAAVALGARDDADSASASGLTARDAAVARRRLADAGVIVAGPDGWTVDYPALRRAARDSRPPSDDEQGSLSPFVVGRQLRSMPAQAQRRREVLDHVATTTFAPGQQYAEGAVDERLKAWCTGGDVDHAALRRYLVEGGHLVRGSGIYALPSAEPPPLGPGERWVAGLGLS